MEIEKIFDVLATGFEIAGNYTRKKYSYFAHKGAHPGVFKKSGNYTSVVYGNGMVSTMKQEKSQGTEFFGYFKPVGGQSITQKNMIPISDPGVLFYTCSFGVRVLGEILRDTRISNKKEIVKIRSGAKNIEAFSSEILAGYSEEKKANTDVEENPCALETCNEIKNVA